MKITDFNNIINTQSEKCLSLLCSKGIEYAPNASIERDNEDRLAHFKKAAAITSTTPKAALLGMLSKHIVSVSDMCTDNRDYPIEKWDEKITDSINYLLILRAIVEEEKHEQN